MFFPSLKNRRFRNLVVVTFEVNFSRVELIGLSFLESNISLSEVRDMSHGFMHVFFILLRLLA